MVTVLAFPLVVAAEPASRPASLPFIEIDRAARQVRVQCQAIRVEGPLEFFCVAVGGPEHEAVLRTRAKPSDVHLALLMLGLEPGEPVRFSQSAQKWLAPAGPPIRVSVRLGKDHAAIPAGRLMRSIDTKQPMPDRPFVFTGSRLLDDGRYAADMTGYIVSIVNFDLTPIDVPQLASNANDTLSWEINPDVAPEMGSAVTMILEPVGEATGEKSGPATSQPSASARLSDVTVDQAAIDRMKSLWESKVSPHGAALREAAQTHYEVINALRREQQRLIDEADRIQRLIDELERKYQDMTTPRPGSGESPSHEGATKE